MMKHQEIYSQAQLMELIDEIGFLPTAAEKDIVRIIK